MKKKKFEWKYILISLFSLALFIFVWYLVTDILHVFKSQALPSPTKVVKTLIKKFTSRAPDGGTIPQHVWASLKLALYGFGLGAVIGIPTGILMAWNHTADMCITPIFNFLRPIPPIAWIPLMLIFFGIGQTAKAAVIFTNIGNEETPTMMMYHINFGEPFLSENTAIDLKFLYTEERDTGKEAKRH